MNTSPATRPPGPAARVGGVDEPDRSSGDQADVQRTPRANDPAAAGHHPDRRRVVRAGAGARRRAGSTSSTSAAAPAAWPSGSASSATGSPWSTPAPTPWPPSTAGPASTTSRSPAARATCPACSTWPAPTAPTWCCATASSRSSTTPPPRWRRWRAWSGPGECSACWSPSATPPWSPGPWPATSSRRSRCSTTTGTPQGRPGAASPTTSSPRWCATPGSPSTRCTGIRVFTDLVPGSLLDLEPGATAALVELEQAVASRPEYLPLATQLHLLAHRSS